MTPISLLRSFLEAMQGEPIERRSTTSTCLKNIYVCLALVLLERYIYRFKRVLEYGMNGKYKKTIQPHNG